MHAQEQHGFRYHQDFAARLVAFDVDDICDDTIDDILDGPWDALNAFAWTDTDGLPRPILPATETGLRQLDDAWTSAFVSDRVLKEQADRIRATAEAPGRFEVLLDPGRHATRVATSPGTSRCVNFAKRPQ